MTEYTAFITRHVPSKAKAGAMKEMVKYRKRTTRILIVRFFKPCQTETIIGEIKMRMRKLQPRRVGE